MREVGADLRAGMASSGEAKAGGGRRGVVGRQRAAFIVYIAWRIGGGGAGGRATAHGPEVTCEGIETRGKKLRPGR